MRAELLAHVICAIGIYLGRFQRLNSWYLITKPQALARGTSNLLFSLRPLLIIAVTFVLLSVLFWIMKQVNLKIMLQIGTRNAQGS